MSDSSGLTMLLLGPAGAGGLYWMLYRYYRNTDKSFDFEHKAKVEGNIGPAEDDMIGEVKGTQKKSIDGNNVNDYRQRVRRV
jgi:hypothetical protein